MKKTTLATALLVAVSGAQAGTYFEPLSAPNTNTDADSFNNAPFSIPVNWKQELVASREIMSQQFADRGEEYPYSFANWDMLDFGGDDNEFVFIPHEVDGGAGITRLNRDTGEAVVLLQGNLAGFVDTNDNDGWNFHNDDFTGLDPAVISPNGTLLTGEEWGYGSGRMFEMANPTTATGADDAEWRWLSNIPSVSHEGVQFDSEGRMYFIDEYNSGSIYRLTPNFGSDLSSGKIEVLVVDAYDGNPAENYNSASNAAASRTGAATWVTMVDEFGAVQTTADPYDFSNRGGRYAADELNGTPYGRPEDLTVGTLANGNEAVYFATTSENIVYSIELTSETTAMVGEYVNSEVTPDLIGNDPVGTGNPSDSTYGLDDPDNLASDVVGNIFIIEDENPGDVFMAHDADKDGVAESVSLFASLGQYGSEPTGFKNDPRDPFTFYVNIQHPTSHGHNDSLWVIKHDIADMCGCQDTRFRAQYVKCVSKAAKKLGIQRSMRNDLVEVAANSSCGKEWKGHKGLWKNHGERGGLRR